MSFVTQEDVFQTIEPVLAGVFEEFSGGKSVTPAGEFPRIPYAEAMLKYGSDKPDLKAEFNSEPHTRGTCSMARTQVPDSANSQFFICFDDAEFLDGQYTVWGQVESGMEHVDALPKGEPPKEPGKIVKATVS